MIDSIPAEIINIHRVKEELNSAERRKVRLTCDNEENVVLREQKETLYAKINEYISTFDVEDLKTKMEIIENIIEEISAAESKKEERISDAERLRKKIKMLEDHEYDPDCRYCCENKFVKDAHVAKATLPVAQSQISNIDEQLAAFEADLQKLYPNQVEDNLAKYEKILTKKTEVANIIADLNLEIERTAVALERIGIQITESKSRIDEYEQNKEAIENLEQLMQDLAAYEAQASVHTYELETCESCVMELVRQHGSLEQMLKTVKSDRAEYLDLHEKYAAFDLFLRCTHSNGIAYDVIKKKLPVINQEIAKVLANITSFEVFFEDNGKKFDIFIKHPAHDARPIEMASGAEKTLAAMAIRLSVLSVSSLPKGDLFVLDEPGTALDEENMEGFIRLLQLIKVYFKNVLLISHLDSLKDCVDLQIMIDKKEGFAKISH